MNIHSPIKSEGRRKRLGQYFSGARVGRLLAAVANAETSLSIIDPMVGSGDLIEACLEIGATPELAVGIEIDDEAANTAVLRLPGASILRGSAFDPATISRLPSTQFELVIGNPPFVRYQHGASSNQGIPDAATVRQHLLRSLESLCLPDGVCDTFGNAATAYSGHADLAVPACILSMALVAPGGRLALVLPQAWLARNYSAQVRACLSALFDVEAIIEDDSASWFPDALVKTSLLVAKRRRRSPSPHQPAHRHIHLGLKASNGASLVGNLMKESSRPEIDFAASLRAGSTFARAPGLIQVETAKVSEGKHQTGSADFGDPILRRIASQLGMSPLPTCTLGEFGVTVGQGLRTGANDFFYVQPSADGSSFTSPLSHATIKCAPGILRPAVRDQRGNRHAILDLRGVALPEDLQAVRQGHYDKMPRALAEHVRRAANTLSGKPGRERPIPELSAVKTNVRPARRNSAPRFWYMLPDFQPRHLPDAYIPRVCSARPQPILSARDVLIDANFATLRCDGVLHPTALMAILNSNWVWAWLEIAGAVMGGGALKIESTMLDRMPIPALDGEQLAKLAAVGTSLANGSMTNPGRTIDKIMLGRPSGSASWIEGIQTMAEARLSARSKARV